MQDANRGVHSAPEPVRGRRTQPIFRVSNACLAVSLGGVRGERPRVCA